MENLLFKKYGFVFRYLLLGAAIVLGFWVFIALVFAQNEPKINKINDIQFAAHPNYTRLIFELDKNVPYHIDPDFKKGIVSIVFENSELSQQVKNKLIDDKRIEDIQMEETVSGEARVNIKLIFTKNTFFHLPVKSPPRLIFDIKNKTQVAFKNRGIKVAKAEKEGPPGKTKEEIEAEKKIKEEDERKAKELAAIEEHKLKLAEESDVILSKRVDDGREDYFEALKIFQSEDYQKAKEKFWLFLKKHPKSKYSEDATFLKAESDYRILSSEATNVSFQPVIVAFEQALGRHPKSKYEDMALYRLAESYDKLGLQLEAKANLKIIMADFPDGRYAARAELRRAQILMDEKKYEFAYKELLKVVKRNPSSREARDATFTIGNFYFDNKDYEKAIKVYEEAAMKWPTFAQLHPDVVYNMGESNFLLGNMEKAKSHFFSLVNLFPNHQLAPKSLNKIGEIYNYNHNNEASAKVFQETLVRKPDSEEADYSLVRLADLGIIDPSMRFNNLIFNYDSFYDPVKTYKEISEKYKETDLAQMAMLREGISLSKNKSYTAAITKYKKILDAFPDTAIKDDIYKLIRESFFRLIDSYYNQKGYIPLLMTYHNNLQPFLKEIDNPITLFRIGQSYQATGLYDLALANFRKAKSVDEKGLLSELLALEISRIALKKRDYKKAESEIKKFIKKYGRGKYIKDAMQILAESLYRQEKYNQAVSAYTRFLKRFSRSREAPESYYYLANSYFRQKKYKSAVKRYIESIKLYNALNGNKETPPYIEDSYFKVGECYFKTNNYSKAIKMYKKAIEKNPGDGRVPLAQYLMAKSYNALKQDDNAIAAFKGIGKETENEVLNRVALAEIDSMDWDKKYKDILK